MIISPKEAKRQEGYLVCRRNGAKIRSCPSGDTFFLTLCAKADLPSIFGNKAHADPIFP
jgi:hypothetical protein